MLSLDAMELAKNDRNSTSNALQCIKCKKHFKCSTKEKTKAMQYYHYKDDECVNRSVKYMVPAELKSKYNKYYTAYAKDFIIYSDFEANNKKQVEDIIQKFKKEIEKECEKKRKEKLVEALDKFITEGFILPDEFDFYQNQSLTTHEVVSARYLVLVNDSRLNLRTDHPMFGQKIFILRGITQELYYKLSYRVSRKHVIH